MKILVVGGGGREHALIWKLWQSPRVEEIYCAPGNAGISQSAVCVPLRAEDVSGLLSFAREKKIDLTVVGPEAPLVAGLADTFQRAGLLVFGPESRAARIEGSKSFAKELMQKYGVPTAKGVAFQEAAAAKDYLRKRGAPCVVKADGLAAGKGVTVAKTWEEAQGAIEKIMEEKIFGEAGKKVIIEDYLEGEEVSVLALTDGKTVLPLASSQDHKRLLDGDKGPNTGGMGAYSPAPVYTAEVHAQVVKEILTPVLQGLAEEGCPYRGVLYAGLIITAEGPQVLEFNCRFGDPETQVVLVRLGDDLLPLLEAVATGNLKVQEVSWRPEAAACVVLTSQGYPGSYVSGKAIQGLEKLGAREDVFLFHAGTAWREGKLVTAGGRVLGVTALGEDLKGALARAYAAAEEISFEGMHYRRDIGQKAFKHLPGGL